MSNTRSIERRRGITESGGDRSSAKRRKIILPAGWKRDFWLKSTELRPAIRAGLRLRESRGSLVVEDPETSKKFVLKGNHVHVFLLSNGQRTARDIESEIQGPDSQDQAAATAAVNGSFVSLIELGLLVLRRHHK